MSSFLFWTMFFPVRVVQLNIVAGDRSWCFDNLSGLHHRYAMTNFVSGCQDISHHDWYFQKSFTGLHILLQSSNQLPFYCSQRKPSLVYPEFFKVRVHSIGIEVITWPLGDMTLLFKWNIFQGEMRNFVSPSSHVTLHFLYKRQWKTKPFHFRCERYNLLCNHFFHM